jgi:SAM-dependent methyltransferase
LERIIQASSNPGDLVLDPFCGCGTTVTAAQKLGRQWIGIDVTHLAVALMESRLRDMFGDKVEYKVVGVPTDLASALDLAERDRFQFQFWALSLVKGQPANQSKRGADRGIDGYVRFADEAGARPKTVIVQVKSGTVHSNAVSELCHVVLREKAEMGFFITLEPPSRPMITEALSAGYYRSPGWNREYQKVQIRTIEQLLAGQGFDMPPANITYAQAERVKGEGGKQGELWE